MKNQVLLIEDVDSLGRSGDIVTVKPGYARNFLLPQKKAVVAQKHLVRLQERLREERSKKAAEDKKTSESLAKQLEGKTLKTQVKIDSEGHMYGSVAVTDVIKLMSEQLSINIEKRHVIMPRPFKKLGEYEVELKLNEGVPAKVKIEITPLEA